MYFSAESGKTAALAKVIAEEVTADLFEIKPEKPYTRADLNYLNPVSRVKIKKIGNKKYKRGYVAYSTEGSLAALANKCNYMIEYHKENKVKVLFWKSVRAFICKPLKRLNK